MIRSAVHLRRRVSKNDVDRARAMVAQGVQTLSLHDSVQLMFECRSVEMAEVVVQCPGFRLDNMYTGHLIRHFVNSARDRLVAWMLRRYPQHLLQSPENLVHACWSREGLECVLERSDLRLILPRMDTQETDLCLTIPRADTQEIYITPFPGTPAICNVPHRHIHDVLWPMLHFFVQSSAELYKLVDGGLRVRRMEGSVPNEHVDEVFAYYASMRDLYLLHLCDHAAFHIVGVVQVMTDYLLAEGVSAEIVPVWKSPDACVKKPRVHYTYL